MSDASDTFRLGLDAADRPSGVRVALGPFLTTVGKYAMYRTAETAEFVLVDPATGERPGVYPTAKAATDAGIALIAAAYRAAL